ncbi:MAG: phosphotransferase family protein [Alphaproteobacteria bacterium]
MPLKEKEFRSRLEAFIADGAGAPARITALDRLSGGALQENWLIDVEIDGGAFSGGQRLVMRTSPPQVMADSLPRSAEYTLLKVAFEAGVTVPEPLWLCRDAGVIGKEFFVMRRVPGVSLGQKIVRDPAFDGVREALAERLSEELARIHTIRPGQADLDFLDLPEPTPALYAVATYRAVLDRHPDPHPVLEWGLRWLEKEAPPAGEVTLCHRDFRTGNYLVDPKAKGKGGLTGIIDWEFSGWGDPMEDIGFFCSKSWRFRADDRPAGGLARRQVFYESYERASGRAIDPEVVRYWEAMANMRWAVIALQQAQRHLSGIEASLELAAIGRRTAEMELEILLLTDAT